MSRTKGSGVPGEWVASTTTTYNLNDIIVEATHTDKTTTLRLRLPTYPSGPILDEKAMLALIAIAKEEGVIS